MGIKEEPLKYQDLLAYEKLWGYEVTVVSEILRRPGRPDPAGEAVAVLNDRARYPYLDACLRSLAARFYWITAEDRRVGEGDKEDSLLVYLTGVDLLVTDDKALRTLAGLVHGPKKQVLSFDEFIGLTC